jgi:hypothetical protein
MPTLLECSYQDIQLLSPLELTRLLRRLLYIEAKLAGFAASAVQASLKIDVPDGGEDGRIEWKGGPGETNWFPARLCLFQSKATALGPSACKGEMVIEGTKQLKPRIEEVLDSGGAYVLFYGRSCNTEQQAPRIAAIREALREAGKSYADSCAISIYDANRIAAWASQHLSAIVHVFAAAGKPLPPSLENWTSWSRFGAFARFAYVAGDATRDAAISQVRAHLSKSHRNAARLVGLSGLGKSRLALEMFRPPAAANGDPEQQALSDRVAYINADEAGQEQLLRAVHAWRREGVHGILVVDNCDKELHNKVESHVKHEDSKLSLLTIGPEPESSASSSENFPYIQLGPADNSVIAAMLKQHHGALRDADIDFIVKEVARGFPQMAVLVADARLEKRDVHSAVEDSLLRRLLGTPADDESAAFQVIRHCALFEHLGIAEGVSEEYKWVARFAEINPDRFYEQVEKFKDRGILSKHGNFVQVRPAPLAMRLAADWWRQCSPEKATRLIEGDIPERLAEALCERIRVLDYVPAVRQFVEDLCGEQRPFGQAKVLNSELGSRLFRSLVEVNPAATAMALKRAFADWSIEDLQKVESGRRNLVGALEKLCFWKATFPVAAPVLLSFAAAENEDWSNNSTGIFLGLFKVLLSGTQAEPRDRFAIIDYAMAQPDGRCKALAVRALGSALQTGNYIGTRGPEQQGSRFPEQEWRPKYYKQAFEYWGEALVRITKIALGSDSSLAKLAQNEVSHHIRSLVAVGRVKELDHALGPIIDHLEGFWPQALEQIQNIKEYDFDRIPDEGKAAVARWEEQLQPRTFAKRLALIVTEAPWEHRRDTSGTHVDVAAEKASGLAEKIAHQIDELLPLLPMLLTGAQRKAFPFGFRLAQALTDAEPVVFAALTAFTHVDPAKANPSLISGMFSAQQE